MQFLRLSCSKNAEKQLTAGHFANMSFRILINIIFILADKVV